MRRGVGWCLGALLVSMAAVHAQDTAADARARVDRLLAAPQADWARLADAPELGKASIADALVETGDAARRASEFPRAIAIYDVAQAVARRTGDATALGAALNGAADAWYRQSAFDKALATANESVALHEREQLPAGLAQAWNTIGNVHHGKAEYQTALECYQKSLALRESLGDQRGIAQAVNNIGAVHKGIGHYPEALKAYRRALAIFESLGDTRPVGIVADNIGIAYFQQGDYGPALEYVQKGLAANQAVDNKYGLGKSFDSLGNIYRAQGAYRRALDAFAKALALRQAVKQRAGEAETVNNIGLVHFAQGDYARAIAAYARSLRLNTQIGDKALAVEAGLNLGAAAWMRGERARAEANFRQSLAVAEREGYDGLTAEILQDLGEIALWRRRIADAEALFARSLAIRERIADQAGITSTLTSMASARLAAGHPADGEPLARRAVATATTFGQPELLWSAQTTLGVIQRRLGRLADAERALTDAVAGIEQLRRQVVADPTRRAQFFEARLSPYHELAAIAVERRAAGQALEIAERAKARAITELLQRHAAGAAANGPEPFGVQDAEALVRDGSIAALEYLVAADRAYVIAVTREASGLVVTAAPIAATRQAITDLAIRFHDRVAARDLAYAEDGVRLRTLLLGPVQAQIAGRHQLVIVPDGPLWQVPFQALPDDTGRFVIESAAVSYAPSLTAIREIRRRPEAAGARAILAMGKADFGAAPRLASTAPALTLMGGTEAAGLAPLPDAERQVRALREIYGPERAAIFVGRDATEDRFKREAPKYRVLHLATHGVLDEASPLYSHVVLSPGAPGEDGLLEAWEIMKLRLDADVVVLSACDTARGRIAPGEGVIGMRWALLAAGARSMVVSQWQVEASSTAALMTGFHRGLAGNRAGRAENLRAASLALLATPERRHPFYWAGFILVGAPF